MYKEYPPSQTAGGPPLAPTYGNPANDDHDIVTNGNGKDNDNDDESDSNVIPIASPKVSRPRSRSRHSYEEHKEIQLMNPDYGDSTGNDEVHKYIRQHFKVPIERNSSHSKSKKKNSRSSKASMLQPEVKEQWLSDDSVVADMTVTPRAVGTDAFSRIRSRSIQNKLAQKKAHKIVVGGAISESKEMDEFHVNNGVGRQRTMSIKSAKDVCPFWNPFEEQPKCPYLTISNNECALKHLTKSQYLDRLNEDDTIELLSLLLTDSLTVEASVVIEKLLEINPENDEYNTCMGDILEELGRYEDAERYYKIALTINPRYDDAHNNYAMMLHHKLNRVKEAEQQYRKCLAINSNHQVCHTNYAKLLQHTLRYKEAEKHFKKCLKLNEENVNCQHYYGVFLYELGRWSEAKYHLEKAIELTGGDNPSYHYNYAKLLCDLKELSEADEQFRHCLRLEPENAAFNFEFALFLAFDLKDVKKSIEYFVKAYVLDPHNSLISKKYDEIAKIIQETGLSKVKRRRSSARFGGTKRDRKNGTKKKHTIVEYKEDDHIDANNNNPCQAEFARFLQDNLPFDHSMNIYLKKFKDNEFNDIRYLVEIDVDTLTKDIAMNKIHIKIMMRKIEKFKEENFKFIEWLSSIALQEYYKIFEQNGILTFESFYYHIQSEADLIHLLGDRNQFDVDLLWKSCPKIQRQNSLSLDSVRDGAHETGDDLHHHDHDNHNDNNMPELSQSAVSSQVEGKQKWMR